MSMPFTAIAPPVYVAPRNPMQPYQPKGQLWTPTPAARRLLANQARIPAGQPSGPVQALFCPNCATTMSCEKLLEDVFQFVCCRCGVSGPRSATISLARAQAMDIFEY